MATPPPRYEPLRIVVDRRDYNATWHIDGDSVVVSSAYGSAAAALRRGQPVAVAERLLKGIVARRFSGGSRIGKP